jgi:hypothetical protein
MKLFMLKKSVIFRKLTSAAALALTIGWLTSCAAPSATKAIAVDQPNRNLVKPTNQPTPASADSDRKIELPDSSTIPTITYCELIKNAAAYDRKIVRVRGIYFNGFERMFFYDDRCVKGEAPRAPKDVPAETWIEWDGDYSRKDVSDEAKKYHAVKSGERADVTVVGRFYATRDINNTGSGKYQVRIVRVEKISSPED